MTNMHTASSKEKDLFAATLVVIAAVLRKSVNYFTGNKKYINEFSLFS